MEEELWAALESQAWHLSVFQTRSWARVLKSTGIEPRFVVVVDGGAPVLGLLMSKSRFLSGVFSGYEAMGGPLAVSEVNEDVFSFFLSALKGVMEKEGIIYFYWNPSFCLNLKPHLRHQGFLSIPSATFVVELRQSSEVLWRNLKKNTRRGVKKAERSGVSVVEAEKWPEWGSYYDLYLYQCWRKHVRPRSIRLHRAIFDFLLPEEKVKLFVARRRNKLIAGTMSLVTSHEMVDYEGASDSRYLNLYPNNAVQWYAMCWAKDQGIKYYDFGGALWEPDETSFLYGVHMFKSQWGGKLKRYNSLALNKLYVILRSLSFKSSKIRQLLYALEKLKAIERSDRM